MPLVLVDPAYTSQTRAECGHVDKRRLPATSPNAARACGMRGVSHASPPPRKGCLDGGANPAASWALPPNPVPQGRAKLTVGHIKLSVSPLQAPLPSRAARQEAAGTGCERRRCAARRACPVGDFQGIAWSGPSPEPGCSGPRPPNRHGLSARADAGLVAACRALAEGSA
ncbi:hypothetical protein [Streptomyces sp. NPDC002078]